MFLQNAKWRVCVGVVGLGEGWSPELAHPSKAGATVVSLRPVVCVSLSRLFPEIYQGFAGQWQW